MHNIKVNNLKETRLDWDEDIPRSRHRMAHANAKKWFKQNRLRSKAT